VFNFAYGYIARGIDYLDRNLSYDKFDASLRTSFLENKLSVILYTLMIFLAHSVLLIRPNSSGVKKSFSNYFDKRLVGLQVTYNFGKQFSQNNRGTKNEEEVNKVN